MSESKSNQNAACIFVCVHAYRAALRAYLCHLLDLVANVQVSIIDLGCLHLGPPLHLEGAAAPESSCCECCSCLVDRGPPREQIHEALLMPSINYNIK